MKYVLTAGMRFGRWTLVRYVRTDQWRTPFWLCVCECGVEREVSSRTLRGGTSKSCGCWNKEAVTKRSTTHGLWNTPVYAAWSGMVGRCLPTAAPRIRARYFDRGITVCERWRKFENFMEDMGPPPLGYELDRIDNDRGYEASNCRWVTHERNCNNRSTCVFIEVDGVSRTISDWARVCGVDREKIRGRIRSGHNPQQVVLECLKGKLNETI